MKTYFRKISKENRIIVVVENGSPKDIIKMGNYLKEHPDWSTLVTDDRYRFIEVPKDVEIKVLSSEHYFLKKKRWWHCLK